jgi:cytochrome c5
MAGTLSEATGEPAEKAWQGAQTNLRCGAMSHAAPSVFSRFSAKLLGGSVLAVALVACFPKAGPVPGPVTPEAAKAAANKYPGTTEAQLTQGRELFTQNCNKCHGYPDVNAKEEGEWPHILDEMAGKAKLDGGQKNAVLHFVLASRTAP